MTKYKPISNLAIIALIMFWQSLMFNICYFPTFDATTTNSDVPIEVDIDVVVPKVVLPPTFAETDFFDETEANRKPKYNNLGEKNYECRLVPRNNERFESLSTTKDLATLVLFQSNGGHQLQRFVAHHAGVVGMERIVIIDHQRNRSLADPRTESLLAEHHRQGADVWRCNGSFQRKAEMWTSVIRRYLNSSQFVFPLDVDELIAVKVRVPGDGDNNDNCNSSNNSNKNGVVSSSPTESLRWNAADFKASLDKLPDEGHMFKTEVGQTLPVDCSIDGWNGAADADAATGRTAMIEYVGRTKTKLPGRMDKVFFRTKDFDYTEKGNHWGSTHRYRKHGEAFKKLYNRTLFQPSVDPAMHTGIYLLHVQVVNFGDWLIHALRGASDVSVNKLPPDDLVDCKSLKESVHYCYLWNDIVLNTGFDPNKMRELYRRSVCRAIMDSTDPFPVGHLELQ